jgi:hypothetical protein
LCVAVLCSCLLFFVGPISKKCISKAGNKTWTDRTQYWTLDWTIAWTLDWTIARTFDFGCWPPFINDQSHNIWKELHISL